MISLDNRQAVALPSAPEAMKEGSGAWILCAGDVRPMTFGPVTYTLWRSWTDEEGCPQVVKWRCGGRTGRELAQLAVGAILSWTESRSFIAEAGRKVTYWVPGKIREPTSDSLLLVRQACWAEEEEEEEEYEAF